MKLSKHQLSIAVILLSFLAFYLVFSRTGKTEDKDTKADKKIAEKQARLAANKIRSTEGDGFPSNADQTVIQWFWLNDPVEESLTINFHFVNCEPFHSIYLYREEGSWHPGSYPLTLDSYRRKLVQSAIIRLGNEQSRYQLLFDTEYRIRIVNDEYIAFRTPKRVEGVKDYEIDVAIEKKEKPAPPVKKPIVRNVKLTFDTTNLNLEKCAISYGKLGFDDVYEAPPEHFMIHELGEEFAIYKGFKDNSNSLAVAYIRNVVSPNLGILADSADLSITKTPPVEIEIQLPGKVKDIKAAKIYYNAKTMQYLSWFSVLGAPKDAETLKGKIYPGKWILKWQGLNGAEFPDQHIEVKKNGEIILK